MLEPDIPVEARFSEQRSPFLAAPGMGWGPLSYLRLVTGRLTSRGRLDY